MRIRFYLVRGSIMLSNFNATHPFITELRVSERKPADNLGHHPLQALILSVFC